MNTIELIKAEIERRWKDYRNSVTPDQPKYRTHYFVGKGEVCEELLSFLDTLEEEPVDFEKAWEEYGESKGGGAITVNVKELARHFYELGSNAK